MYRIRTIHLVSPLHKVKRLKSIPATLVTSATSLHTQTWGQLTASSYMIVTALMPLCRVFDNSCTSFMCITKAVTQHWYTSVTRQTSPRWGLRNIQNKDITSYTCWENVRPHQDLVQTITPEAEVGGKYFIHEVSWRSSKDKTSVRSVDKQWTDTQDNSTVMWDTDGASVILFLLWLIWSTAAEDWPALTKKEHDGPLLLYNVWCCTETALLPENQLLFILESVPC